MISFIEYGVFNWPDERMNGWRLYRMEYGGHAEECITECQVWLPPNVDVTMLERWLNRKARQCRT